MTNETTASVPNAGGEGARTLDLLLDVPLEVTVEIGRTRLPLRELLRLGPGGIVEFGKAATEPVDVLVNGRLIARGETVIVNERFGVRLTDVVSTAERLAGLG